MRLHPVFLGLCCLAAAILGGVAGGILAGKPQSERDRLAVASPSPFPTPEASSTPEPSPSNSPSVAGLGSVHVSFYGVQLSVADPITDLVYGVVKDYSSGQVAGFTTEALIAQYPACKAGALGTLVRTKASPSPSPTRSPSPSPSSSPLLPSKTPSPSFTRKSVGGYTYTYKPPAFACVSDQAGRDAIAAAKAALVNAALPTLSN